jgi:hypothetical protein
MHYQGLTPGISKACPARYGATCCPIFRSNVAALTASRVPTRARMSPHEEMFAGTGHDDILLPRTIASTEAPVKPSH